ncbi:cupin, partial [Burkholderia pseudomallei]
MTNLSRRKMLAATAGALAAASIAVSAKAASFGNPDSPAEGAVNARNPQ